MRPNPSRRTPRPGRRAILPLAGTLLLLPAWLLFLQAAPEERRALADDASPRGAPGYVGSRACTPCHGTEYRAWEDTLHSRMEQPATAASVVGDFTPQGTVVKAEATGRRIVMIRDGDAYWIEAPDAQGRPRRYRVDRTVGNRYKQRYLTRLRDGSWHILPVQWNRRDDTFVEFHGLASGEPGSGRFWLDGPWRWQLKCAGCHTTGLELGYRPEDDTWDTRWVDLAIGCEACHGPGEAHVRAKGGTRNIVSPKRLSHARQLDLCGRCHGRGSAGPEQGVAASLPGRLGWPQAMRPGDALASASVQVTPETHPQEFHRDGSSRNHHQQWIDYQRSGMLREGGDHAPTCTTCHDPHRADALRGTIDDNRLCLRCHLPLRERAALAAHTGHGANPLANPGARCVECHMPRIVNHAGSVKLRSHTFRAPDPRRARETGTPDACLLCHRDRDAAWSVREAERLWPRLRRSR
jgi:predicted CXXCH cytochrome family protein